MEIESVLISCLATLVAVCACALVLWIANEAAYAVTIAVVRVWQ